MDFKKEWDFQKGQALGMLPTKDDLVMAGAAFVGTVIIIAFYSAASLVISAL